MLQEHLCIVYNNNNNNSNNNKVRENLSRRNHKSLINSAYLIRSIFGRFEELIQDKIFIAWFTGYKKSTTMLSLANNKKQTRFI